MREKLKVVAKPCMDEDLDYGDGVVVFGSAGTMITRIGGGNQQVYPDRKRELVANTRGAVSYGMRVVANEMGLPIVSLSHEGCGAGAAQEIVGKRDLMATTKAVSREVGDRYGGHIPYATRPVRLGNKVKAHIGRPESDHKHWARRIAITVGGGITERELKEFEKDGHGDAFLVSADWIQSALESGQIAPQQVLEWLMLHVDIADGIADGVNHVQSVRIYDAGRLSDQTVDENVRYVEQMMRG